MIYIKKFYFPLVSMAILSLEIGNPTFRAKGDTTLFTAQLWFRFLLRIPVWWRSSFWFLGEKKVYKEVPFPARFNSYFVLDTRQFYVSYKRWYNSAFHCTSVVSSSPYNTSLVKFQLSESRKKRFIRGCHFPLILMVILCAEISDLTFGAKSDSTVLFTVYI